MEYWCIDRMEGAYAVCEREDGRMEPVERTQLPEGAREGDVLTRGEDGTFRIDQEETERRRLEIQALEEELFGQ